MAIDAFCPSCSYKGHVPEKFQGRKVKCPWCSCMFTVGGEPSGSSASTPALTIDEAKPPEKSHSGSQPSLPKSGSSASTPALKIEGAKHPDKSHPNAKPSSSKNVPVKASPAAAPEDPFAVLEGGPASPPPPKSKKTPALRAEDNPFATLDTPAAPGDALADSPRRSRPEKSALGPILGLLAALCGMIGLAATMLGVVLANPALYKMAGLPLSGFGLFLGFAGFLAALFLRSGMILSSIGSLICGMALLVAGGITMGIIDPAKIVQTAEAPHEAKKDDANKDDELKDGLKDGEKDASKDGSKPPTSPSTLSGGWVDAAAKGSATSGDVNVQVADATVDYVKGKELTNPIAKDRFLQIRLVLTNTHRSNKVEFRSWGIAVPGDAGIPQLTDNTGKALKFISSFGPKAEVEGQSAKAIIFPDRYIQDLVIFEAPSMLDKIDFLRLELPSTNVGGSGSLKFHIPRTMVSLKSAPPPTAVTTPAPPTVDAKLVPELRNKLKNPDKNVRMEALTQLGAAGSHAASAVPEIIGALKDKDEMVRLLAIETIGKIGPAAKAAVPALIEALQDMNVKVRATAARALGQIGPAADAAYDGLFQLLREGGKEEVDSAIEALRRIGSPKKS